MENLLVLVRHGESEWNRLNLFTGWHDVDLSEEGMAEAHHAGILLKEDGCFFDLAFTSTLTRGVTCTLKLAVLSAGMASAWATLIVPVTSPGVAKA